MSAPLAQPAGQPPSGAQPAPEVVIAALAVVLASQLPPLALSTAALPLLALLGIHPDAGVKALSLVIPHDLQVPTAELGPAARHTAAHESVFRAAYLAKAGERFKDPAHSLAKERAYAQQHVSAQRARAQAAAKVDSAAKRHGDTLGWYAVLDDATTPDCRAANGHTFSASNPPKIGLPGAVHTACRCKPGPPILGARTVDQATARVAHHDTRPDVIPFPVELSSPLRRRFEQVKAVLSRGQD